MLVAGFEDGYMHPEASITSSSRRLHALVAASHGSSSGKSSEGTGSSVGRSSDGGSSDVSPQTLSALSTPIGMAMDAAHNYLYVCDSGNDAIRRLSLRDGHVMGSGPHASGGHYLLRTVSQSPLLGAPFDVVLLSASQLPSSASASTRVSSLIVSSTEGNYLLKVNVSVRESFGGGEGTEMLLPLPIAVSRSNVWAGSVDGASGSDE